MKHQETKHAPNHTGQLRLSVAVEQTPSLTYMTRSKHLPFSYWSTIRACDSRIACTQLPAHKRPREADYSNGGTRGSAVAVN